MSLQHEAFLDKPKSAEAQSFNLSKSVLQEAAGAVIVVGVGTAMTLEGFISAIGGVIGRRKSERQLPKNSHEARIIYIGKPKN